MPVALDLAPLAVMALCTALILILFAYQATVGQLIKAIVSLMQKATINVRFVHVNPFSIFITALDGFDKAVMAFLGKLIVANQWAYNRFTRWNAYVWSEVSGAVAYVAEGSAKAISHLRHVTVPALITGGIAALTTRVAQLEARIEALHNPLPRITNQITKVIHAKPVPLSAAALAAIYAYVRAHAPALPQAIPNPWPRIHDLERSLENQLARVKGNAGRLTVAGILGVTLAALSRAGLGWVKCSNVSRAGKAICGMDHDLLESLLLGGVVVFGTLSIVEIAEQMLLAEEEIVRNVLPRFREFRDIPLT